MSSFRSRRAGLEALHLPAEGQDPDVHPETEGDPTLTIWTDYPAGMTPARGKARAGGRADHVDANPHAAPTARPTARTLAWWKRQRATRGMRRGIMGSVAQCSALIWYLCVKIIFTNLNCPSLFQLKLPESLPSQRLPGLQPAVHQLRAWPPLYLWLQQRPVGEGPDPEGTHEGH